MSNDVGVPIAVSSGAARAEYEPAEVMLDNMNFWFGQARRLSDQLEAACVDLTDENERRQALRLLGSLLKAREEAQKCAEGLAPYRHARFSNVAFAPTKPIAEGATAIPDDPVEASVVYQRLIRGAA